MDDSKPVAKKLRPFLAELRPLAQDARPTFADLSRMLKQPGKGNDLLDLTNAQVPLRDVAVARRQRERQGPRGRVPRLDRGARAPRRRSSRTSGRTPSTCSAGSTTSATPASTTRSAPPRASASTPAPSRSLDGQLTPVPPELRDEAFQAAASTDQRNRCPGGGDHTVRRRLAPVEADAGLQLRPDPGPARGSKCAASSSSSSCSAPVSRRSSPARPPARRSRAAASFTVELDNAFGIVNGADVKVAGVRAGRDHRHARGSAAPSARWSTSRSTRRASARCAPTRSARRARSR